MAEQSRLSDSAQWSGKIYNGRWVGSAGGTIDVQEKATGSALATVGLANGADVRAAALAAKVAQKEWAKDQTKWSDCQKQSGKKHLDGRKSWSFLYSCMTS